MAFVAKDAPKELILEMLSEECSHRKSGAIQERYDELDKQGITGSHLDVAIQWFVLGMFGFDTNNHDNLLEYQKIPGMYADDEDVKAVCFYIDLNIFEWSVHNPGDDVPPNIKVHCYKTQKIIDIHELMPAGRPVVFFVGSMT